MAIQSRTVEQTTTLFYTCHHCYKIIKEKETLLAVVKGILYLTYCSSECMLNENKFYAVELKAAGWIKGKKIEISNLFQNLFKARSIVINETSPFKSGALLLSNSKVEFVSDSFFKIFSVANNFTPEEKQTIIKEISTCSFISRMPLLEIIGGKPYLKFLSSEEYLKMSNAVGSLPIELIQKISECCGPLSLEEKIENLNNDFSSFIEAIQSRKDLKNKTPT